MTGSISPINITGAALIAQISILVIMFICSMILTLGDKYVPIHHKTGSPAFAWIILPFTLITIGCLLFSDEFSSIWIPLFGSSSPPSIKWSNALLIVFTLNIICVTIMVWRTGGSQISAFSPIYFIFPALAIFLREPFGRIIFYLIFTAVMFTGQSFYADGQRGNIGGKVRIIAYWFVSIACFVLATYIGCVTRPQ